MFGVLFAFVLRLEFGSELGSELGSEFPSELSTYLWKTGSLAARRFGDSAIFLECLTPIFELVDE